MIKTIPCDHSSEHTYLPVECMYVCSMHVYVDVCMHVYVYVCINIYTGTPTYMYVCLRNFART